MGATNIEWCDFTFNPWSGCTKVSAGCANCYAETLSGRNPAVLGVWGPKGARVVAAESQWKLPIKWNKAAFAACVRHRVFCASLADVFEGPETVPADAVDKVTQARKRLGQLILDTPNLDWLLLTKRPANILPVARDMWVRFDDSYPLPPNVWIGTTVENQLTADERIPHLLRVPAAVRFLSCEPLLGPVDLSGMTIAKPGNCHDWLSGMVTSGPLRHAREGRIHWVIVGGESGTGARPMHPLWATSLRDQCVSARVPFFFKQFGNWKPHRHMSEAEWSDLYERVEATPQNPEPSAKCFVRTVSITEHPMPKGGPCDLLYDLGKKVAGRLLDGREWSEFPEVIR